MSNFRLTESQVDKLNLQSTDWRAVAENGYQEVYIQAHEDAPVYGPYQVLDPEERTVCRIDGTGARRYPRSEGLYVTGDDVAKIKIKKYVSKHMPDYYKIPCGQREPASTLNRRDPLPFMENEDNYEVIECLFEEISHEIKFHERMIENYTERLEELGNYKRVLSLLLEQ